MTPIRFSLLSVLLLLLACHLPAQDDPSSQQPTETPGETQPADDNSTPEKSAQDPLAEVLEGHSYHGEAFNEGPRQSAYLMGGTGKVHFPVTTTHPDVQQFIEQGIGQLHGFWDLEAERTFRHAAALDPDCAMAYWGAALATKRNAKRARGFIDKAVALKSKVSPREQKYIDALNAYLPPGEKKSDDEKKSGDEKKSDDTQQDGDADSTDQSQDGEDTSKDGKEQEQNEGDKKDEATEKEKREAARKQREKERNERKKRAEKYTEALESIALEFPDDLEAKAFLALQIYDNRRDGISIQSYLATDGLMEEIFQAEPMHPTHHFRIHLWDLKKPEKALKSAALCGQSAPRIAHMWHMPGHIYSRLNRYEDAVWQQEASARVDHAHMMRDRVMPDEIHNFAHNNEWMIRNLIHIGAVQKAIDLAKNMSELPRHPKYNTLDKRGSNRYGRERLFQVLNKFGVWDQTIALCNSVYLEPTDKEAEQRNRLRALGIALYMVDRREEADKHLAEIQKLVDEKKQKEKEELEKAAEEARQKFETEWAGKAENESASEEDRQKALDEALKKAREEVTKKHSRQYEPYEKVVQAIEGFRALKAEEFETAYEKLKKAGGEDETLLAEIQFLKGDRDKALEAVKKSVEKRKNEVIPLARYAYLLDLAGKEEETRQAFEDLRKISSSIDMNSELFTRLNPIAEKLGYAGDWRQPLVVAEDVGDRPELDELGPIHWSPSPAPQFTLKKPDGTTFNLADYKGRPIVIIFYLGASCLHCSEQLQAFAPQKEKFARAGIELVAISTDDPAKLNQSLADYGETMPITLMSNDQLDVFKKFRAYDDFENLPLHGTFLIDEAGLVRWQDISYEPFMDHEFLYNESLRLLAQKKFGEVKTSTQPETSVTER